MNCLFCSIAKGEIPAKLIHRDEEIIAFHDINPQAPQHILIIPIKHIPSVAHLSATDTNLMGNIIQKAAELAYNSGIKDDGYRLVINCGNNGGQTVDHLHVHLLGGRAMHWPPG